jgi:hypothetical protein
MTDNTANDFPSEIDLKDHLKMIGVLGINKYTSELQNLPDPLKVDFMRWWKTGNLNSSIEVQGLTVRCIAEMTKCDIAVAFAEFSALYQNHKELSRVLSTATEPVYEWD